MDGHESLSCHVWGNGQAKLGHTQCQAQGNQAAAMGKAETKISWVFATDNHGVLYIIRV